MATYGLDDSGFTAPSLQDILDEKEESYKAKYGDDFQAIDKNIIWQNAVIEAERELNVWQVLESVYYSQTLDGAEGIYLDNVLGQQGVYRNDASYGSGYAVIISSSDLSSDTTVSEGAIFSATNSIQYELEEDTTHRDRIVGMYVTMDDFDGSEIDMVFNVVNTWIVTLTLLTLL